MFAIVVYLLSIFLFNKTIENATLQQDDPLGLMEMETAAPSGGASNAMEDEHFCHSCRSAIHILKNLKI